MAAFHQVRFVIFVEGREDLPFWDRIARQLGLDSFHIKIAGGSPTLDNYAKAIVESNVAICVCRDLDYRDLLGTAVDHPRILHTYGYSIENTLCTPAVLSSALRTLLGTADDSSSEIESWQGLLEEAVRPLIVRDLACRRGGLGVRVPLTTAPRLCDRRQPHKVSRSRVNAEAAALDRHLTAKNRDEAERLLRESPKRAFYHLRRHFVFSAALALVVHTVRKRSRRLTLSPDALFAVLVPYLDCARLIRAEQEHYQTQIAQLAVA